MANERINRPIPIQEGYQPGRMEQRGYPPNVGAGCKPNGQIPTAQNLTPPTGGSAIAPASQASQARDRDRPFARARRPCSRGGFRGAHLSVFSVALW